MRWAALLALGLAVALPGRAEPKKVACIGDSITLGVGVANPRRDSYPAALQRVLGKKYTTLNFGSSGATLLKDGNNPYWETTAFRDASRSKPDIVVIALGTNDSKPINWDGREENFRPDCEALIAHFAGLSSRPKVLLCLPPPSFQAGGSDIRERILARQRRILREIARQKKLPLIDLNAPLQGHPEWLPDGVHPNAQGARVLAETVARSIQN